jgi:predicted membrane protein
MSDEGKLVLNGTFGSTKRSGRWTVPPHITLRRRFGSAELDFTSADFQALDVVMDIDMVGGSIELRVPNDVRVESELSTTFASYEDHRKTTAATASRSIRLRGRAVWGSVETRGPKK